MRTTLLLPSSAPPPPSKSHLACHLSPRPPEKKKKKITPRSLQGPSEDHVKLLHLLQRGQGERALTAGSYLREWKVGGVKGVNATQREVRKGKLAIHEALGRGAFFFWGGGGDLLWSCEQIPLRTQHNTTQCRVSTVSCSPGDCKHYPNKEKHVNQEGYFKMCSDTVTNYLLQKCVICNVIHLSQNLLLVLVFFVRIYTCCHLLQTSSFIFEIVIRLVIHIFTKYML